MKGGTYTSPRFRSEEYFLYEISEEMFSQTYGDLYRDAMLVLTWVSSNMADGNQQKHLLTSFARKFVNLLLEELINIKVILFLTLELFR